MEMLSSRVLLLLWSLCVVGGSAWVFHPKQQVTFGSRNAAPFFAIKPRSLSSGCCNKCHRALRLLRCNSSQSEPTATAAESAASPLQGKLIASDAIPHSELSVLCKLIESCTPVAIATSDDGACTVVVVPLNKLSPGATGRVAIIELPSDQSIDEEFLEEWQEILCQEIDEILYSEHDDSITQPILLSFVCSADDDTSSSSLPEKLISRIEEQILDYGLADSVEEKHNHKKQSVSSTTTCDYVPSLWYQVDGALVMDGHTQQGEEPVWDTSSIVVFDDLISPDLREQMLQVVLGHGRSDWNDMENGPDPSRWSEGGLIDLPQQEETKEEACSSDGLPISYGLTDEALEELCHDAPIPEPFEEFEKILVTLFANFTVARLPEAVLGGGVTPLTANAPCFGQEFNDHIDADPFFAPPSPWTDVYGRYANRARGKPRFVSCLIYLNDEWNAKEWGAPTRFYDVASETAIDVSPKPGRVVLMDQDITHTVVTPLEAAGKRPRYSLVWKLIFHPKKYQQDMRQLADAGGWGEQSWPDPIYIGSAKQRA